MKQVKERREKVVRKTTIVPKMSLARQSYIKRFRRRVIREANLSLRQTIEETKMSVRRSSEKKGRKKKRKMTIDDTNIEDELRRVRFDEESNETYENPRWIEDFIKEDSEEQLVLTARPKRRKAGDS